MHYGQPGVHQCTIGIQVYTSALWAFRCTPLHYGLSGVHQCTIGKQLYNSALWAYGQSGGHQCTMDNQVYTSALWGIRCTPVHYGQSGVHQTINSMLCSSPNYGLSVLRSGVLQMALAIHLPIAFQQSIGNVMTKCILI